LEKPATTSTKGSTEKRLIIYAWNLQWYNEARYDELKASLGYLKDNQMSPDVLILTDLKLLQSELERFPLEGYKLYGSLPEEGPRRGGIIIAVRSDIHAIQLPLAIDSFEAGKADAVVLSIPETSPPIWVAGLYCPDKKDYGKFTEGVGAIFTLANAAKVALFTLGDHNAHGVYPVQRAPWSRTAPTNAPPPHPHSSHLLDLVHGSLGEYGTLTIVQKACWTRRPQGRNSGQPKRELDYIVVNAAALDLVEKGGVISVGGTTLGNVQTDHRPIYVVIEVEAAQQPKRAKPNPAQEVRSVEWSTASKEQKEKYCKLITQGARLIRERIKKGGATPLKLFEYSVERLLGDLIKLIRSAEDKVIGVRLRPASSGMRFKKSK
jgi:hypothetical protein